MKALPYFLVLLAALVWLPACRNGGGPSEKETAKTAYRRIVSLSGAITETLFLLEQQHRIVGIDVTSTFPGPAVDQIAQLGHVRRLNVEALLSLRPDLVILEKKDENIPEIQKLAGAGLELLIVETSFSLDSPLHLAEVLTDKLALDDPRSLADLRARHEKNLAALRQVVGDAKAPRPKVLFIYARGKGSLMVAGRETPAAAMIELAGGTNAVGSFEGFKALSPEGLIQAQPDVFLLFESGLRSLGGAEGLLDIPGAAQTPAGRNQHIIAMDGLYLLGFTPRAGAAALDLARRLSEMDDQQLSANN